jgi:hypothetical protein
MSGGYFEYNQYKIYQIVEDLEDVILNNGKERVRRHAWEDEFYYQYPPEIIAKFKEGLELLKKAHVYAHRIDWLLSGNDGEESFLERLESDLSNLNSKS